MEEKLAQYRAAKQKEYQQSKTLSDKLTGLIKWIHLPKREEKKTESSCIKEYSYVEKPKEKTRLQKLLDLIPKNVQLLVFALTWTSLWCLFIHLQFGAVYFAVSLLIIMYYSMRTERDPSHLSAYSVFNPNFERIDGTFTAEQFEKELRFGPAAVH